MASFIATYESASGQTRTITIKAADLASAKKLLRRRGIRSTGLRASLSDKANRKGEKSKESSNKGLLSIDLRAALEKTPGVKEKAVFANKLSALVNAGIPIVRSLDLMASQQRLPMFKRALMKVSLDVNEGTSMGTAMRQWPKVFDHLSIAMVEAGELGGVLDESLQRLAKLLEDNNRLKNQIKGAMGYPITVLIIAILVFLGMTIFLIPTFAGIFEDLGAELPQFTQFMVDLSKLLRSSFSLILAG
ncbi:MAG TPA: type II secretion system F family protein, partial [Prochlorococcus sp.]